MKRCKAVKPVCMFLGFKSSPSFREKLAEREESIDLCRLLFHNSFLKCLNFRTIKIGVPNVLSQLSCVNATPTISGGNQLLIR